MSFKEGATFGFMCGVGWSVSLNMASEANLPPWLLVPAMVLSGAYVMYIQHQWSVTEWRP